jgi:hypothetical protein
MRAVRLAKAEQRTRHAVGTRQQHEAAGFGLEARCLHEARLRLRQGIEQGGEPARPDGAQWHRAGFILSQAIEIPIHAPSLSPATRRRTMAPGHPGDNIGSDPPNRLQPGAPAPNIDPMSGFSRRVKAVLGPTNTGKTHLAIERMLSHSSGIIGFPLRLLARENYDRMVIRKGVKNVALITGEEKIVPPEARWFACTVEAMPLDRDVEFVAVDEIQLCADPARGHVFTDRLLHARGLSETMFLGAETIRPLIRALVPHAEIETRPRLSELAFVGQTKLVRLPPRSAIVAFSAGEVYALAELIRRRRGRRSARPRGRRGGAGAGRRISSARRRRRGRHPC